MAEEATPSESFHSETHAFDPLGYIKDFYSGTYPCRLERDIFEWLYDKTHQLFFEGKYRGKSLLDVGTGPAVMPIITASEWFDEVFLSDLVKDNVDFLHKWMKGEAEATKAMAYQMEVIATKEGKGVSWEEKNSQVRAKVKEAFVWDMHKPEMLKGTAMDGVQFDLVTSCQCMCAASSTMDGYAEVIKNIGTILKPRGHLVILDYLDQTYYTVNDEKFSVLSTTEEEIKTTFKSLGFEIEHFDTHILGDYPEPAPCDAKTLYCVVGKKL